MIIGRRKFFSFFGTGVALLAKPDLFIPKKEVSLHLTWDPAGEKWTVYYIPVWGPDGIDRWIQIPGF